MRLLYAIVIAVVRADNVLLAVGDPDVRSILYMATLTATRCNPVIREMYQCLLKAGKKKKVAMVACMRKLLIILNPIVRDRSHWNLAFSA